MLYYYNQFHSYQMYNNNSIRQGSVYDSGTPVYDKTVSYTGHKRVLYYKTYFIYRYYLYLNLLFFLHSFQLLGISQSYLLHLSYYIQELYQ